MTKILLINTNCSWNKGSAAQVISTVNILKKIIPETNFTLISARPELDSKRCVKYNVNTVGYFSKSSYKALLYYYHISVSLIFCIFWKILNKLHLNAKMLLKEKHLNEYIKTDIIIDLSGDTLADSIGSVSIISIMGILIGILLNKPIVVFSQSIGPFKKWSLTLARFCLNKVDLIIVREEITKKYLEKLKISSPIFLTADCAFILETASYERVEEILSREGINIESNVFIGISPSFKQDSENYVSLIAQIIDYIIENLKSKVIIIPHVVKDIFVSQKIHKKIINKDKVTLIKHDYSPEELKGIICLCDMFIGARMHANIAALSTHVPTVAIAWSHKYYGIMRQLGQEKYVFDFRTMTFRSLVSKIDELWSNRNKIRKELTSKIKTQKELVLLSGKLVKCLLRSLDILSSESK